MVRTELLVIGGGPYGLIEGLVPVEVAAGAPKDVSSAVESQSG